MCRYWARAFRPKLFQRLSFNSLRDLEQLAEFLDESRGVPFSDIPSYLDSIVISPPTEGEPFLHLLHGLLVRCDLVGDLRSVHVAVAGPLRSQSARHIRSIHWLLPKRLPSSFSSDITTLFLTDLVFQSFDDLVRLLYELRSLGSLTAKGVSWVPQPTPLLTLWLRRWSLREKCPAIHCEAAQCTQYWPFYWLTALLRCNAHDAEHLCALGRWMELCAPGVTQFNVGDTSCEFADEFIL